MHPIMVSLISPSISPFRGARKSWDDSGRMLGGAGGFVKSRGGVLLK